MASRFESPTGPSQRQLRVGEQIRHALAELFLRGDVHEPEIAKFSLTVPEVRMSPDLKLATVYVMPLGGLGEAEAVTALNKAAKRVRHELARHIRGMKTIPDLRFRLDDRFDEAARIDTLFDDPRVKRDLGAAPPAGKEDDGF